MARKPSCAGPAALPSRFWRVGTFTRYVPVLPRRQQAVRLAIRQAAQHHEDNAVAAYSSHPTPASITPLPRTPASFGATGRRGYLVPVLIRGRRGARQRLAAKAASGEERMAPPSTCSVAPLYRMAPETETPRRGRIPRGRRNAPSVSPGGSPRRSQRDPARLAFAVSRSTARWRCGPALAG